MLWKLVAVPLTLVGLVSVSLYLLTLPGLRSLPAETRQSMDGILTLADAAAAARASGLEGWELVAYAQNLVYRKFRIYSLRNPWDSPARAFERGMGYCQQYNLALQELLSQLGFESRAVYATSVLVPQPDGSLHAIGHTWLKVRIGDEERDVCAGAATNRPGVVHFELASEVRPLDPLARFFGHLGSVVLGIRARNEPWSFREREPAEPEGTEVTPAHRQSAKP